MITPSPRFARFRATTLRAIALAAALLVAAPALRAEETALDRYLAKPDPAYKWELVSTLPGAGVTTYVLGMTSQTWRSPEEVDRVEWKHWLIVNRPDELKTETAMLIVSGGGNNGGPPDKADPMREALSRAMGAILIELKMIPNQPLVFADDNGRKRNEDAIIAYTWTKFMETGDEEWPLRLPMVKASIRAMDAVQEFTGSEAGGGTKAKDFIVVGASKRGWTTWLVGATDKRVRAIVPLVIDVLNVKVSMLHHYAAYGFYAPAVGDYVAAGITEQKDNPAYDALLKIEDPYSYLDRIGIPKFVVNAAGDQFFLPDSWQFYWNELQGEKHLRYVPNTDHGMGGSDTITSVRAFFESIVHDKPRPEYSWTMEEDGSIRFETKTPAKEVKLWKATNPEARDFRLMKIGRAYTSETLGSGAGTFVGKVEAPEKGFTAYFVEATYGEGGGEGEGEEGAAAGGSVPLKVTSGVRVIPDVLPFKDKIGK